MSDRLFSVKQGPVTESGIWPSANPLDVPLWADGRNIVFKQGGPQKVPGFTAPTGLTAVSTASNIRGMGALQDTAAVQRLFLGDTTKLRMWVAGTLTDVTRSAGAYTGYADEASTHRASVWSFVRFGNNSYATNGKDVGQQWLGSGVFSNWTTSWTTAEVLLVRGPHILAFNTNNFPGGVEWCTADDPNDWTPDPTKSAGFLPIRDIDGDIISACNAMGEIIVAAKNQLYRVAYISAPLWFNYQSLGLTGVGAVGKAAMVGTNRMVYGMAQVGPSEVGIWETDGVTFRYIDTEQIRDFITANINFNQLSKVCFSYDSANESLWISFPGSSGENEYTLVYRIPSEAWSILPYGRSAMTLTTGVFTAPYMAGIASAGSTKVFQHSTTLNANGVAIDSYVRTKPLDCGDANQIKAVDYVLVQFRRLTGTARVRVGWSNDLDDDPTWSSYATASEAFGPLFFRTDNIAGRFLTVEVGSVATGADWAITGFEIWGDVVGTFV